MILWITHFIILHIKQLSIKANFVLVIRENVPLARCAVRDLHPATKRTIEFVDRGTLRLFGMDADQSQEEEDQAEEGVGWSIGGLKLQIRHIE